MALTFTQGLVAPTQERAEVAATTAGVYTFPGRCNLVHVVNESGQRAYVRHLQNITPDALATRAGWAVAAGSGWLFDGGRWKDGPPLSVSDLTEKVASLTVGKEYRITYTVEVAGDAGVLIRAGTTAGTSRTANGTYTQMLTCAGNGFLSFTTDVGTGSCAVKDLIVEPMATAVTGESHVQLAANEATDITFDGAFASYGYSLWLAATGTASKCNASGSLVLRKSARIR